MNTAQAQDILHGHKESNPAKIEQAYKVVFGTDLKTRLLVLVAQYPEPNRVNTELDQYGWNVMSLIRHLYA